MRTAMSATEDTRVPGRFKAWLGRDYPARVVWVAQHAVLGLSTLALAAAALRAASLTGATGLERIVAAAPIAAAVACLECVLLGIVGLGSSPVALALATGVVWLLARRRLPRAEPYVLSELGDWWRARS